MNYEWRGPGKSYVMEHQARLFASDGGYGKYQKGGILGWIAVRLLLVDGIIATLYALVSRRPDLMWSLLFHLSIFFYTVGVWMVAPLATLTEGSLDIRQFRLELERGPCLLITIEISLVLMNNNVTAGEERHD